MLKTLLKYQLTKRILDVALTINTLLKKKNYKTLLRTQNTSQKTKHNIQIWWLGGHRQSCQITTTGPRWWHCYRGATLFSIFFNHLFYFIL